MRERSTSFLEKLLWKDRTAHTYLYELDKQKVEQLRALIREFGVVHKHLEDAKETELDTHRTFFEIKGKINSQRRNRTEEVAHPAVKGSARKGDRNLGKIVQKHKQDHQAIETCITYAIWTSVKSRDYFYFRHQFSILILLIM